MLHARRFREIVIVVIGVVTPLGILAVNASAFVMQHLQAFRLVLSVSAFVSALFLNSLAAWAILNRAHLHVPDLLAEYRRWIVAAVVVVVLASAAFGAYFTWLGMGDPKKLPDPISVVTAALLLVVPFAVTWGARQFERRRAARLEMKKEPRAVTRGSS
jgi:hypothetical protein